MKSDVCTIWNKQTLVRFQLNVNKYEVHRKNNDEKISSVPFIVCAVHSHTVIKNHEKCKANTEAGKNVNINAIYEHNEANANTMKKRGGKEIINANRSTRGFSNVYLTG